MKGGERSLTAMEIYPTSEQYLGLNLLDHTLEERGVLFTAKKMAVTCFEGKKRRDGQETVKHSRALALKAKELNLSVVSQAIAWGHDLTEDCGITPEDVGKPFGPQYGPKIAFGIDALTFREGKETVEEYFNRIAEASTTNYEIVVVKIIDRWHFHLCPYGDPARAEQDREKVIAKAAETLTVFNEMCERCRPSIPLSFLPVYDELVEEVLSLALNKALELGSTTA